VLDLAYGTYKTYVLYPRMFLPPTRPDDKYHRKFNMNIDYDTVLVLKSESHNLVLIVGLSSPVVFQQVPFNLTAIMPSQTMSPSFPPPRRGYSLPLSSLVTDRATNNPTIFVIWCGTKISWIFTKPMS